MSSPHKLLSVSTDKPSPAAGLTVATMSKEAESEPESKDDAAAKAGGSDPQPQGDRAATKGVEGSLSGATLPRDSSHLELLAGEGSVVHPGASPQEKLRSPKSPSSPVKPCLQLPKASPEQISLPLDPSLESSAIPSQKLASLPNPSPQEQPASQTSSPSNPFSQAGPASQTKIGSPPNPSGLSVLGSAKVNSPQEPSSQLGVGSPKKVNSPPNPFAKVALAPQAPGKGGPVPRGASQAQGVAATGKGETTMGAQPLGKTTSERKRTTAADGLSAATKKSSVSFGGLSLVPLPIAKPTPPEEVLTAEQMDEDYPYWAGRNGRPLPSWQRPSGANTTHVGGHFQDNPSIRAPPTDAAHLSVAGPLDAAPAQQDDLGRPAPGECRGATPGLPDQSSQHVSCQDRQQPHQFLQSLGSHDHSQQPHDQTRQQAAVHIHELLTEAKGLGQFIRSEARELSELLEPGPASEHGLQHVQDPQLQSPVDSQQTPGISRQQPQQQSRETCAVSQGTSQHPQHAQQPAWGSHPSRTPAEANCAGPEFGVLRPTPISAQPQSVRVKLSYKWGAQSAVSGLLDLMAYSWSINRMGKKWSAAGEIPRCIAVTLQDCLPVSFSTALLMSVIQQYSCKSTQADAFLVTSAMPRLFCMNAS